MSETFDAYVLDEQGPAVLRQLSEQDLPDAEVTVDVSHSSLNYKDGLAMTGQGRIARRFPMVCGIDLAGTVAESRSPDWQAGDEVIVTGAAGGVGSVAVALLAGLGYEVHAATGRPALHGYLRDLGATAFVDRAELAETSRRPLESEKWAGAVDTVGAAPLATVLKQTRYGGAVAACGLAAGSDLPTTVLPHILRGVSLLGIDSVLAPAPAREQA